MCGGGGVESKEEKEEEKREKQKDSFVFNETNWQKKVGVEKFERVCLCVCLSVCRQKKKRKRECAESTERRQSPANGRICIETRK